MDTVIYADVLIILNLAVNYFLLLATSRLCRTPLRLGRMLLGAAVGAVFALYILLPPMGKFWEFLIRPAFAAAITFAAFGRRKSRRFLRLWATFLLSTLLFGGAMMAVYNIFRPEGMAVEGGVLYFRISPLLLVVSTAVCYALIRLFQHLSQLRDPHARRKQITLVFQGAATEMTAMVDTGHSLRDPFSGNHVVLLSQKGATRTGVLKDAEMLGRYRLIPCRTAHGDGVLQGFKTDRILVDGNAMEGVVAAVSDGNFGDDYDAIISPDMLV